MKKDKEDDNRYEPQIANIYLLFENIDNDSASRVCEWILHNNYVNNPQPDFLNLIINSPGGSLLDAYAIIDIMESSRIPVRTIGLGCVQSAGLMVFLAGEKGHRILTPNTSIMSHQYSWCAEGKHNELIAINKEYELTYSRMLNHYKKYTKLSITNIKNTSCHRKDMYLSAEEALNYKICDKISLLNT